ncbi:hypothetical protein SHKM778_12760 [Streptomyces sp. KM77-8]|uniref:Ubiquitin Mut7-C domain-containing protein n=1 Tax=Streptomyces haneummycinicus TaxID=3074435 RepID=A0AAT9HBY7_9ACTN
MNGPEIHVEFASELLLFVPRARPTGATTAATDGVSTLGHVVESLGVPLTEVGTLLVDGREVPAGHVPAAGESVTVRAVAHPQRVPGAPCASCSTSTSARWPAGCGCWAWTRRTSPPTSAIRRWPRGLRRSGG